MQFGEGREGMMPVPLAAQKSMKLFVFGSHTHSGAHVSPTLLFGPKKDWSITERICMSDHEMRSLEFQARMFDVPPYPSPSVATM